MRNLATEKNAAVLELRNYAGWAHELFFGDCAGVSPASVIVAISMIAYFQKYAILSQSPSRQIARRRRGRGRGERGDELEMPALDSGNTGDYMRPNQSIDFDGGARLFIIQRF